MNLPKASIIISSWNGRHLLQTCLPCVLRAVEADRDGHEVIVVDDASTDDTVDFVRREFPQVRLLALSRNLRFAGANNAAARIARGDVLVFLNNDMLVEPNFLDPLLRHFADPSVFAATAHIQMAPRLVAGVMTRETGLVRARFESGVFVLRHEEPGSDLAIPVFYAGGGSSAWRRDRFFQLGGFDRLFRPFYFEDLDLSYRGQKAGWRVIFEPASRMIHQHRQTNAPRNFPAGYVDLMFCKNSVLFTWKVLTDPRLISSHLFALWLALMRPDLNPRFSACFVRALAQAPELLIKKRQARRHMVLTDREVLTSARGTPVERTLLPGEIATQTRGPLAVLLGLAADLAGCAFLRRRRAPLWGLDPREPPHATLVIRAGSVVLTREVVAQMRARYPALEVSVIAPESLVAETAHETGEQVIPALGAAVVSYQVNRSIISELRQRRFDTIVVAGEGSRRAELLALLAGRSRRVEVRENGLAQVFWFALYQPVLLLVQLIVALVEKTALTVLIALVWGGLQAEGLVWALRPILGGSTVARRRIPA